ncbi:MAG: enoyl-CoA hydratase [Parasphingorhabdus sp.]|jgi:enoyl-CoA hydratase
MTYNTLIVKIDGPVGIVTLNRPKALNALSDELMNELTDALESLETNDDIGAIVLTGSQKAFAAGADINELKQYDHMDAYYSNLLTRNWEKAARCRKPVIAAVAGYALGGGCELAMMCDFILAAENAKFGQPEVSIGVIPGAGGTQRLTRFVGKSKAMEMCLTGRMMDAVEAERCGLVSRIVATEDLLEEAVNTARKIAETSRPAIMATKEMVNRAYETTLSEGILFERRTFHSMFGNQDKDEGMQAFLEKRKPEWKHR